MYYSFPDSYIEELQLQFLIDPYLLRFFVLKTDINNLAHLFGSVPMSILILRLAKDCIPTIKVSIHYNICTFVSLSS